MRVLLPIDADSDRAKLAAEAVTSLPSAAEGVQVTLLNVQPKREFTDEDAHVESEEWYDPDTFPDSLETAVKILENVGIEVKKRRKHGDPAKEIIRVAEDISAKRVIMCGRRRTPVGKVLFGSVTQSVLLNSDIPVTVIGS